jgi:hypothetical protein
MNHSLSRSLLFRSLLVALFVLAAAAAQAGPGQKVKVCHIPPGDPGNFHTITVGANALQAHLGHGDLAGSCAAYCDTLCSDGDPCTVDACDASEQCLTEHPPGDCNDGNPCTTDTCSSLTGCVSAPLVCSDGDKCTLDACDPLTGLCLATPVECPVGQTCEAATGECVGGGVICPCADPAAYPFFALVLTGTEPIGFCFEHSSSGGGIELRSLDEELAAGAVLLGDEWACGGSDGIALISPEEGQHCVDLLEQVAVSQSVTCVPGGGQH